MGSRAQAEYRQRIRNTPIYTILDTEDFGRAVVARLESPAKDVSIAVYVGITGYTLRNQWRPIPELNDDVLISPMALFRNSETGYRLATEFAKMVSEK